MADNNNTSVNSVLGFSTQSLRDSVEQALQQGKELENNINGVLKLQYPVFADKIDLAHSYGYTDQQIEPMLRKREQAALTFYSPDDINRVLKRTPQTIQQAAHIENMFRVNALRQATGTSLNDDEIHDRITASKLTGVPASVLISDNNIYEKVKPFAKMRRTLFDSVRIGLANYFRSFNTSKSENDYNNWILSLDDFQLQQAQNNGQLSNEYLDLIETTGLSPDDIRAYAAYKISRAQGWDKAVNSVIDFISPEPSPDPDSMIHSLFEVAPNVAAGIAEFWALKKIPGLSPTAILTFMGAWRGWRNSDEQVYADRIAQGDPVPEAYSKSNNPLGLISGAIHGATSFIVARTLGRPVQPFGIVGPVMQQAANIADASAFSAMGSMAASSFNDIRSEKNPDNEKALQEGRHSALWTGLFGLFSSLMRGKTLLNQQRDFNTLKKINNVLENYGYSPISENFSFQDSVRQIIGDLQKGIITHQEIIDLFSDMGVAHDNIYKFILRHAPESKALNKYSAVDTEFSDMNEQPVVDNNPPQNETVQNIAKGDNPVAAPIVTPPPAVFSDNPPSWVFIPKTEWESYNQENQNNDILPVAEIHETGEVMLNGQDFQRLQENAPDFVERIKDNIRNSANGVTNRERSLSDSDNQQDDNSLNWNSPRIKTLRKKIFQQWREAGYTRGQAKSISDMITDFAINYSYRTGIDPEDAVRISITNRENIYPENPPAENSSTVHPFVHHIEHVQPTDISQGNSKTQIVAEKNTDRIRTIRGTEVDIRYRIIDADDLITSTKDTGAPNPDYPQELQPRQRDRDASYVQVNRIANNLDPELVANNRLASDGAPVIGPDLVVESGNGRVMAIRQAYRTGNAEHYRAWLRNNAKRFGLSPDSFDSLKNPVLVRERISDVDRVKFTREANESSVTQMSASEFAANDADLITESMLIDYNPDSPLESNRSFIRSFVSLIGKNELGAFIQGDGKISSLGLNRIRNALAAKAYRNTGILNRLSEIYDDEIKNVSNALYDAAPRIAMLEEFVADNHYSIRNDIIQAVNTLVGLRKEGRNVNEFLSQILLFSEDEISQEAKKILQFFDRNKRSRKKIARALNRYADLAIHEAGNNVIVIPGMEIPAKSKLSLIDEVIKFAEDNEQVKLFETYNQTEKFSFNPDNPDEHDPFNPYTWPNAPEREKALPIFEELKKLLLQTDINPDKNLANNKKLDKILDEAVSDSPSELATKIHDSVEAIYNLYDNIPESFFNIDNKDADEDVDELVHPFKAFYESDEYKKLNDKYQKLVDKGKINPERITKETDPDTLADINDPIDPYTWPDTPARLKALVIFPPLDEWFSEHENYDDSDMPTKITKLQDRIWELADKSDEEYLDLTDYEDEKKNAQLNPFETYYQTEKFSFDPNKPDEEDSTPELKEKLSGIATLEDFKKAFDELERGQKFVNIPELRKKLSWPHDVFDDMIRKLRDEGIIQLQKTEAGNFALEDFFYDEHDARRGMVRWHEPEEGKTAVDYSLNNHDFDIPFSYNIQSLPDASKYPAAAIAYLILSDKTRFIPFMSLSFSTLRDSANQLGIEDKQFNSIVLNMIDAELITPVKGQNFDNKGIRIDDRIYPSFKINSIEALQFLVEEPDYKGASDSHDDFSSGLDLNSKSEPEEISESYSEIQQQTELNNEEQIKSPNFKRWFGDWENDKQNSSKIVDDHGKPIILEHQTGEEFSVFDPMHEGAGLEDYETPYGIFLKDTDNDVIIENARFHMLLYANIRNPLIVKNRADIVHKLQDFKPYIEAYNKAKKLERDYEKALHAMDETDSESEEEEKAVEKATKIETKLDNASRKAKAILRQWLIDNGYDGMILENDEGYSDGRHPVVMRTVIALHKNQVKSADKNSGAFSPDNDDVYDDGITTPQNTASLEAVHDTELKDIPVAPDYKQNNAAIDVLPEEHVPDELQQPAIKGRISWQKDIPAYEQTSIMELSNSHKDPTTVIHEIGHHMAKLLFDAVQFKGVDGEIKDDVDAVLNHAGVSYNEYLDNKNGEKERVHEDFADEFTKFAASGNAPNERLRRAFSRIRAWLIDLFRDLQRRNYKIDENMRRVFEHLFTSQERIDYTAKIGELASEAAALREVLSQTQNDLRSQIQNNAAIQKENENLQSQLDSAHDEISAQQEQTAQNSLAWEQTAEQAFIRGENTGEVYGIQKGRNYQKQKDKEVFDRALDREHDQLSQLREKKDAQIEVLREQKNNALERLEQKKNSQIERIKERYSDRLDVLADRYDERIAKLKKRLEQISKIKPAIQRNVKQIMRMAKSKSISYNVQQEINALLSEFDLKKRSRDTLSHRQDINELLKNNPQAVSSLSPDEIRFANTTNIADMTLDDLRYLKWQVKVLYDKGRREFEQWQAENKQRRTNIRDQLFDRLSRFKAPDEHIITSREDIGKQYKGIKGKAQQVKDWGSAVLRTPDRVFDILDGGGANYNGPWVENFIDIPREKINDAQNFINSRKDNMIQNLAILGFKISDFGKTAAVIDGQKFSFDKIMEIFLGMRNPKKAKAIIFGNFVNPRGYSPDQAIDVINQLISKLTPEHMKAAELVIKDHQDNFQRINDSLIAAFNKGMKQEVDYTSMHRLISQSTFTNFIDPDDEAAVRYGLSDSQILQKIETGFMLSRQNISDENQQPLDLGLFSNWMSDISRHEFAAALGQTASDLMSVLLSKNDNRQTLMRMISDRFGNTMRKSVISIFNDTFTDNQRIADEFLRSIAGALSRNMSVAYISYNMGVYIMQTMSYPLFLMSASPDYMLSSIAQFFRNPRAFLDNVYSLSPTIKNMGRDPTDNRDNLMRSLNSSFWQKVINAGLEPTSMLDRITKAIGWDATYNTNIRRGLSHEKAIREADRAVRLTQPPSNTRDTMRITRNGSLAALKMKFTYALASAWNMTTYDFIQKLFSKDWNNIKSAFATLIGLALTATLIKFMHDGGPDTDNDENTAQWVAGAFSEQAVNSIPLIGKDAMQSFNKHFRGKYGQSQFDAFNAPIDKVLNAAGIALKEDKSDEDYSKLGSLVLESIALSTGLVPYSGIKQTIRSLMMATDSEPLKGIANFLGFRQKQ